MRCWLGKRSVEWVTIRVERQARRRSAWCQVGQVDYSGCETLTDDQTNFKINTGLQAQRQNETFCAIVSFWRS